MQSKQHCRNLAMHLGQLEHKAGKRIHGDCYKRLCFQQEFLVTLFDPL
jgi:hypothetical protein